MGRVTDPVDRPPRANALQFGQAVARDPMLDNLRGPGHEFSVTQYVPQQVGGDSTVGDYYPGTVVSQVVEKGSEPSSGP